MAVAEGLFKDVREADDWQFASRPSCGCSVQSCAHSPKFLGSVFQRRNASIQARESLFDASDYPLLFRSRRKSQSNVLNIT
jgi:hypothetical protein